MVETAFDLNGTASATLKPAITTTVKFLCSYGGKILPRFPDGKLRYFGGHTRVLAVDRSISFPKLLLKLEDLCGEPARLRCQLPTEDLDALVSIKSDEDLANLIEEYDRLASSPKIRAFLLTPRSSNQATKFTSPPSSDVSSPTSSSSSSGISSPSAAFRFAVPVVNRCIHRAPAPVMAFPFRSAGKIANYAHRLYGNPNRICFVDNGKHWK